MEKLRREVEEVEKKWRELEEVEVERLEGIKWQLEEEKRAEEQSVGELSTVEQRRVALVVPSPEAGLSRAPPWKPERSMKGADCHLGIVIPKKNCTQCVMWESLCCWDLDRHVWSCQLRQQLKKPCRRFKGMMAEGKWKAEDEGEGLSVTNV